MPNISDLTTTPDEPPVRLQLHGVLVRVDGVGVLLLGESGSGKSECALQLVLMGHQLVADDVVEVAVRGDHIVGAAPPLTRGLLAIRGLGIFDARAIFGTQAFAEVSSIDLCLEICDEADAAPLNVTGQEMILGCTVPKLVIARGPDQHLSTKVTTAVRRHRSPESAAARESFCSSNELVPMVHR